MVVFSNAFCAYLNNAIFLLIRVYHISLQVNLSRHDSMYQTLHFLLFQPTLNALIAESFYVT